jgi:aldehyde dehydrogenase (NAD+)
MLQQIQQYFASGATLGYDFRREQLGRLKKAIMEHEQEIYEALHADLKKNREESWVTEIGIVVSEINYAMKKLKRWMKPQRVGTNLVNLPSSSYVYYEPLGTVLIIGPWNYPLQLTFAPLVGAIAAGNCAVLKPSEAAPATAALIEKIVRSTFDPSYITVVQGEGSEAIPRLMQEIRFDHVFFTGSTYVGRLIYEMAASQLIPVTLELGGKSPCIIESDADIQVTAKRIAVTKFSNAGQMCVAPDYLLVHESIRDRFLPELTKYIARFYNAEEVRDYHYGRIINEKQFARIVQYMKEGKVVYGGRSDAATLFVEPTVLADVPAGSKVLQEEIFGPVLPVISWKEEREVYETIRANSNPLALYVFTSSQSKADKWIRTIPFGGGCVNNASWHLTNHHLPFGGRGNSGVGSYHGKYSFQTFSHRKAIMKTPTWFDPAIKYPPFKGKLGLFKKVIR